MLVRVSALLGCTIALLAATAPSARATLGPGTPLSQGLQISEARLNVTFDIDAPALTNNVSLASNSTDIIRQMLQLVMGTGASIAANVTSDLDTGKLSASVVAVVPAANLSYIIVSSCCEQYRYALAQTTGDPGIKASVTLANDYTTEPVMNASTPVYLQRSVILTENITSYSIVFRLIGASALPMTARLEEALQNATATVLGALGATSSIGGIRNSSAAENSPSIDVQVGAKNLNFTYYPDVFGTDLDVALDAFTSVLSAAGYNFTLLYLSIIPVETQSMTATAPAPVAPAPVPQAPTAPAPAASPPVSFTSAQTTPAATIQLEVQLRGNNAIPFTESKQQSMLVATVSYLAALNISATQLKVIDYQEYPATQGLSPGSGKRLLAAPSSGGTEQLDSSAPYVDVIVQMVLSGPDVYILANSKGPQTTTAANSFDAVMAQQGINVQSQLLGARTVSFGPPGGSASSVPSSSAQQPPATAAAPGAGTSSRNSTSCTGGGGASCYESQGATGLSPTLPTPAGANPSPLQSGSAPTPGNVTGFGAPSPSSQGLDKMSKVLIAVLIPSAAILGLSAGLLVFLKQRSKRKESAASSDPPLTADWFLPPPSSDVHTGVSWNGSSQSFYRTHGSLGGRTSSSWGDLPWGIARQSRKVSVIKLSSWEILYEPTTSAFMSSLRKQGRVRTSMLTFVWPLSWKSADR